MSPDAGLFVDGAGCAADPASSGGLKALARRLREHVAEPVLSVLFPPRCVGCGDFESHLCATCEASLQAIGADCCPRCGEPGPRPPVGGRCSHCMSLQLASVGARSAFVHAGAAKRMVVEFKSGGQPVLGPLMARSAAPAFSELVAEAEEAVREGRVGGLGAHPGLLVTWVPTHASARRERGYNQAELLARALACGLRPALPAVGLVRKPVKTRHQKALDRAGRQANLRGAFVLDRKAVAALDLRPGALILVDDVHTTGATTQEVAHVLSSGTGMPVYVFTFSRAVSGGGEGHD